MTRLTDAVRFLHLVLHGPVVFMGVDPNYALGPELWLPDYGVVCRHETAALVTWLIYAVYLHARNQRSWAGRPAALLLVVGFGMVLVTYSGSLWFSGLHAYSGL